MPRNPKTTYQDLIDQVETNPEHYAAYGTRHERRIARKILNERAAQSVRTTELTHEVEA